jgi:arylsulfatase A
VLIDAKSGQVTKAPEWFDRENGYEKNPHDAALYNIREDIAERKNLVAEHSGKAAELRALLQRIREQGYSAPRLTEKQ